MSPPSYGISSVGGGFGNQHNYIEHPVSKMDTLAGVAIKYGVEVADIKRLNSLSTDLQMFALKTLLIPLPGRHPPSSNVSDSSSVSSEENGYGSIKESPPRLGQSNILESFHPLRLKPPKQKLSPAMNTLQKFYGLKPPNHKRLSEGTEMAVYRTGSLDYFTQNFDGRFLPENGGDPLADAEAGDGDGEKSSEKSVRRRQKSDTDLRAAGTPEKMLKEENGGGSSGFSPLTGKGLAMRAKSASRAQLTAESDSGWLTPIPVGLGDSIITDATLSGVRKSSSTPTLQGQENAYSSSSSSSSSSSVWPSSKWSLKTDLQAFSTAAITLPLFDGLPKPITGRRSKAALD